MSRDFQNRLRKNLEQPVPAQHPAPDLLNGYSEHALTAAEEQQVTAHLATCAECREVVYLASAAEEEPVATAPKPAARSKTRWWTWAVPVAAVLAVGTTVLVLRPKANLPAQNVAVAKYPEAPAPVSQPEPVQSAKAPVATTASPAKQLAKAKKDLDHGQIENQILLTQAENEKNNELKTADQVARNQTPTAVGGRYAANVQGAATTNAPANRRGADRDGLAAAAAPAPAPPPPAETTVDVTAQASMPAYTDANPQTSEAARAKAAPASGSSAGTVMMRKMPAMKAAVPAPWAVTSTGKLERFEGRVWKPVEVDPSAFFLTVTNIGSDVWVGGKHAVLMHSADDGATWQHHSLPSDKAVDIVHIEFQSQSEGMLKTGAGGAYITHDGGTTWIAVPGH